VTLDAAYHIVTCKFPITSLQCIVQTELIGVSISKTINIDHDIRTQDQDQNQDTNKNVPRDMSRDFPSTLD